MWDMGCGEQVKSQKEKVKKLPGGALQVKIRRMLDVGGWMSGGENPKHESASGGGNPKQYQNSKEENSKPPARGAYAVSSFGFRI